MSIREKDSEEVGKLAVIVLQAGATAQGFAPRLLRETRGAARSKQVTRRGFVILLVSLGNEQ